MRVVLVILILGIGVLAIRGDSNRAQTYSNQPGSSAAAAQATMRPGTASEDTFNRLISRAETGHPVHVIVGLTIAFQPEGFLGSAQRVREQRDSIGRAQASLLSRLSSFQVRSIKRFSFIPYIAFTVDAGGLKRLREDKGVAGIYEDMLASPLLTDSIPLIGANNAWARGYTGKGQTVAILDTGVAAGHPFLEDKVVSEACYSHHEEDVSRSFCTDEVSELIGRGSAHPCDHTLEGCDHGTHVAGIAAGTNDNFSGVAKGAKLIAIQVFTKYENQEDCGDPEEHPAPCIRSRSEDQIRGLERVQELVGEFSIAAVNMSLGGGRFTSQSACDEANAPMKAAIDNLRSLGIATIIASGNDGYSDALNAPGCISTAVSVGSTDDGSENTIADVVSIFDPVKGKASNSASFLNLLAPGQWIYSSVPEDEDVEGDEFKSFHGTSMAAPHVAGAWAVLKSKVPGASVDEILTALIDTGVPVTDTRNNITKPRIELDAALKLIEPNEGTLHLPPLDRKPLYTGQIKTLRLARDPTPMITNESRLLRPKH